MGEIHTPYFDLINSRIKSLIFERKSFLKIVLLTNPLLW